MHTTDLLQVTDKLYHMILYTSLRSRFEFTIPVMIGTDHTHTHTYIFIYIYMYMCVCVCIYPRIIFTEGLVIGVGFVIVLVLSGLCLLVVVYMLRKFVNNSEYANFFCIYIVFIFSLDEIPKKYDAICVHKFNL